MICWMGDKTKEILDRHGIGVIGFDLDRESNDAWCSVSMNGFTMGIQLGDVEGLTGDKIERRFVASMIRFAIEAGEDGDGEGYEVLDELLEGLGRKDSKDDKR